MRSDAFLCEPKQIYHIAAVTPALAEYWISQAVPGPFFRTILTGLGMPERDIPTCDENFAFLTPAGRAWLEQNFPDVFTFKSNPHYYIIRLGSNLVRFPVSTDAGIRFPVSGASRFVEDFVGRASAGGPWVEGLDSLCRDYSCAQQWYKRLFVCMWATETNAIPKIFSKYDEIDIRPLHVRLQDFQEADGSFGLACEELRRVIRSSILTLAVHDTLVDEARIEASALRSLVRICGA